MSRPPADAFFTWLSAQSKRVSRKSDLGDAMAYMLRRQDGFRLFLHDGRVDMDSNLVENAIRSPAMNRRNALFAGHDEGGRNWVRFASLIGTCKMNGVEPYACLCDLFTRLANGHLDKDIDALMPWAQIRPAKASLWAHPGLPDELIGLGPTAKTADRNRKINGPKTPLALKGGTPEITASRSNGAGPNACVALHAG